MSWPISGWKRGDLVSATVVEMLDDRQVIIRIGDPADVNSRLIRVANETGNELSLGHTVRLRCVDVNPLRFQYVDSAEDQRRRGRIDVSI